MVPLFLDDCIDDGRVVRQLRAAGHSLFMAREFGLKGQDDEPQLVKAAELGAVLVTQNQGDFEKRHEAWQAVSRSHAGILLTRHLPTVGMKIERLGRAARLLSPELAANQLMRLDLFATEERGRDFVTSLTLLS